MTDKTNQSPSVSVIIPCYNCSALVKQSIESVLSQTYRDFEIIIVDDGSTDDSYKLIMAYGNAVKYIYQDNAGGAKARNTGINVARGKYIAFLDSDDLWYPQMLEHQVALLEDNPDMSVSYCNVVKINAAGNIIGKGYKSSQFISGDIYEELLYRRAACFLLQTLLVYRSCLNEIGGLDEQFRKAHDRDLILRLGLNYNFIGNAEILVKFRKHNITERLTYMAVDTMEDYNRRVLEKNFRNAARKTSMTTQRKVLSRHHYRFGVMSIAQERNFISARKQFAAAIRAYPLYPGPYIYYLASIGGPRCFPFFQALKRRLLSLYQR